MRTRLLTFAAIACHGAFAQPIISTIAGMGAPPSGIPATSVSIGSPSRIARDAAGNVYFAAFHCVYKVDPAGILTRVAGTGAPGFGGDGGPATDALLNTPKGVDIDSQGYLYIADDRNRRVRRIDQSGTIVTIAGNGESGSTGDGGPASQASLSRPLDVASDANGDIYVSENFQIVRKISRTGMISTVAGTEDALTGEIDGIPATQSRVFAGFLAVDPVGGLLIGSQDRVRKVGPDGLISTVRWRTHGAQLGDIAVDGAGNLFLSEIEESSPVETRQGRILRIPPSGQTTVVAELPAPTGVALGPGGHLAVSTAGDFRIWQIAPDGRASAIAGNGSESFSGDGGPAVMAQLNNPEAVAVDGSGNVYVADKGNARIRKIEPDGTITTVAGGGAWGAGGDGSPAVGSYVGEPLGVGVDASGNVYAAASDRIWKIDPGGRLTRLAGIHRLKSLTVSHGGDVYAISSMPHPQQCVLTKVFGSGAGGIIRTIRHGRCLDWSHGLAVDSQGTVYATDASSLIFKIAGAEQTTIFTFDDGGSPGRFYNPSGLAPDLAGNLFVVESDSVRRIGTDGRVTTVAGNRVSGYSGDGGPGPAAQFQGAQGLAADLAGNLYVADTFNGRIRKITNPTAPSPGLTIATSPADIGVSIVVDGDHIVDRPPRLWTWPVGSQHRLDVPTPQFWSDRIRYRFSHWSQGGPKAQTILMPEEQTTYRAHFLTDFRFQVSTDGGGTFVLDPPLPADGFYPQGTDVTVTALPAPGWRFRSFRGIASHLSQNPLKLTSLRFWVDLTVLFQPGEVEGVPLRFVAVTPCRVMDTRPGEGKTGPFGARALEGGQTRTVPIPESTCGIPANAAAYSLNATVVPSGALGFLTLWPAGQNQPQVSTLNSFEGRVVANAAIVPAGPGGAINVFVTDETHVILDINGYFVP